MQVSSLNEVKIYSLSAGRSLPEWLSDRKKRALQKKNVDIHRRIELIQDFDMPAVSTKIKVSKDGQYIMATGTYKPRSRCFDTYQLSMKFERCLDAEERITLCDINPVHGLFATGTIEGKVECWDPRVRNRVGVLDCALNSVTADQEWPAAVSALKFDGSLKMAVGTSTGQVLLYDLRSSNPLIMKDHQYGLPVKSIQFHNALDLIISADSRIIKLWNQDTGKIFTSIEPEHSINDVCLYPNSGMLFTANEAPKMNIYYIPVLGPAPKWCSFLDNLTEELEENPETTVYDDYKFVTRKDLENLGLAHLIGSPFLAYMHGFFMDIRLYHKEYRREKIRQKIEETRAQRVQLKKLPKVNKELALKLIEEEKRNYKMLERRNRSDDRFKIMFENPDFQVDEKSEEFRLLNPLVSKISEKRKKKLKMLEYQEALGEEEEEEPEGKPSDAESSSLQMMKKDGLKRSGNSSLLRQEKVKRQERFKEDQKQSWNQITWRSLLQLEERVGALSAYDTTVGSKQVTFKLKR
ncbi:hypothetical protein E2320_019613 [Naja naja]|nr:hypothetical protein E2320_019613 [Naja naja]